MARKNVTRAGMGESSPKGQNDNGRGVIRAECKRVSPYSTKIEIDPSIVESVFQKNPSHPEAVHYMIHAYDDPKHAFLGLRAARAYMTIAPAAPHAQPMPSHIFMALGM